MAESPTNLRSRALLNLVELVSEGEIVGLVNGQRSIYFDDTPLENSDGSLNFKGVQWQERTGTTAQESLTLAGFNAVETEFSVNRKITNTTANGGLGPYTFSFNEPDATAVRLKFRTPGLVESKNNGDIIASKFVLQVEVQPSGGSYTTVATTTFSGKTSSPYERQVKVILSGASPWNIRITRLTEDATSIKINNESFLTSYTILKEVELRYPDSAVYGLVMPAETFGGRIPSRGFLVDGLLIKVPTNYDPVARTYATTGTGTTNGAWDGTFKTVWSNNPAWVFYDLLLNPRYGLGQYIDATYVDKYGLYTIAQYCDELVSDGYGGQEPRFVCNLVIQSAREAYEVLQALSSVFRGMTYWGAGLVTAVQDRPKDPVQLVAPANVVNGEFTYQSTGLKDRHTVAMVRWNDPSDNYKPAVEVVELPDAIQRYGYRPIEITAFGCTSRGQAYRTGLWLLDTEFSERETVTYAASFDHIQCRPGDVVEVADPKVAGSRQGGRLKTGSTTTSLVLDAPLRIFSGDTFTTVRANGDLMEVPLTATGTAVTTVTATTPLPETPRANAIYVIGGGVVNARPFRVVAIRETERHLFEVTAVSYDPNKFARVEQGLQFDPIDYGNLHRGKITPPTNLVFTQSDYRVNNQVRSVLLASWEAPAIEKVAYYEYRYTNPNGTSGEGWHTTANTSMEFENAEIGVWNFEVRAVSSNERRSVAISASYTVTGRTTPPLAPTALIAIAGPSQNGLSWVEPEDRDLDYTEVWGLTTANPVDAVIGNAALLGNVSGSSFIHVGLTPGNHWYYWVRAFDQVGNSGPYSNRADVVVSASSAGVAGYLTNEAHTVATANDGTGGDYTTAGGTFKLFDGLVDKTGDVAVTYSVVGGSVTGGLSISIATTGIYTVSGQTSTLGTATLRAVYNGVTVDKTYSLSKAIGGPGSTPPKLLAIRSDRQAFTYAGTGDAFPAGQVIRFDADLSNSAEPVTWSTSPSVTLYTAPTGGSTTTTGATVYLRIADFGGNSAVTVTATVTDGVTLTDIITIVRIADGASGASGLSIAELTVYRRLSTAPATPTGGSYNFDTQLLTAPTNWSSAIPAGNDPVYVSRGVASIQGISGVDSSLTWSAPVLALQEGSAVDIVFRRSAAQPATPSASAGTPAGWYSDVNSVPASADPLWSAVGTRDNAGQDWTWQTPILVEGQPGAAAEGVQLSASSQIFTYDGDGVASPGGQVITLTANRQNLTSAAVWSTTPSVPLYNAPTGGAITTTGDTVYLRIADFAANTAVTVNVDCEGYYDKVTVVRVAGGIAARTMRLVAEGQAFRFSGSGTNIGVSTIGFDAELANLSGTATFGARNFNAAGTQIASYGLSGAGNANRMLHVDSFRQSGSTVYTTVVASLSTAPGYSDQITVHRLQDGTSGVDGVDAVVGYLTNEAHTLPASSNGFVPAYTGATGQYILNKGSSPINTNSLTFSILSNPQTLTASLSTVGSYIVQAGFDEGEELATLTFRAVFSGTNFDKTFSLGKTKAGAPGSAASLLSLKASGQQFRFSGSGTSIGVNTLTFEAALENLSGTAGFYVNNHNATGTLIASYGLAGTGNTNRALHVDSFRQSGSTAYALVVASLSGYTDRVSVVRLQEGADGTAGANAVAGYLTNEAHTLPASSNGHVTGYAGAVGQFFLFEGISPVATSSITFSLNANPQVLTASISTVGSYIVQAGFDAGETVATLTLRALYKGVNYDKTFSLSKSIAGVDASPPPTFGLIATAQQFRYSGSGTVVGVSTIGFDVVLQNLSGDAGFYANNYNAAGTMIASYGLAGTGNFNRALHVNSFTQGGSTIYAVVVASLNGGYSDRVSVVRLQDGAQGAGGTPGVSPVAALLTNEAHTLPASSNGFVPAYTDAVGQFLLYQGTGPVSTSSITFSILSNPQVLTASVSVVGSYIVQGGFDVGEELATLTLRAVYAGANYDKTFSLGKNKSGLDGSSGTAAQAFRLASNAQAFSISGSGTNIGVNTILFDGLLQNVGGTATFFANNYTAAGTLVTTYALGGTGNANRHLHINSFLSAGSTAYSIVVASLTGGFSDRITVVRLQDGAGGAAGVSAVTGLLTNEAHTLPASSNGFVPAYTGAVGQYLLYQGTGPVSTSSITFSLLSNPQVLTASISTVGSYIVQGGLDAGEELATLTLRAVYAGANYDKTFSLGKNKSGLAGSSGTNAQAFGLTSNAQAFQLSGSDTNIGVNTILFDALLQNVTGTATFFANNFTAAGVLVTTYALGGAGNTNRHLHINSFLSAGSTAYATVVSSLATAPGFSDRITVVKLRDGAQGGTGPTGPPGIPAASMILNGGFETGDNTGWAITAGTIVGSAAGAYSGSYYLRLEGGAGGPDRTTVKYPAIPGEVYRFSVMVRPDYTTAPNSQCMLNVRNYYDNGTQINVSILASDHAVSSAAWRPLIAEHTVPNSTAYIAVSIGESNGVTGFWLFDELTGSLKGADGTAGVSAVVALLTNEAHTVPASANGFVTDYVGAVGQLVLYQGTAPVATSSITFSILSNPQTLTSSISTVGSYIVQGGFDVGEETATLTLRGVYAGTNYDKTFSLGKTKAGLAGSSGTNAQTFRLTSNAQAFAFSGSGTNVGVSTILFDGLLQNVTGTATFYANNYLSNGTLLGSYALGGTGNANRHLHINSFLQAGSTAYSIITASLTGGFSDRVTVIRLQDGTGGAPGQDAYPLNLTPPTFTNVASTTMGRWILYVGSAGNASILKNITDPYGGLATAMRVQWMSVSTVQVGSSQWLAQWRHGFTTEPHKPYISYVAFMVTTGHMRVYGGYSEANSAIQLVDGSSYSNAYFIPGQRGVSMPSSRWYLGVGVWHPQNETVDTGLQGIYDYQTGSKFSSELGIRQMADVTSQFVRIGAYVSSGDRVNSGTGIVLLPIGTFAMDGTHPTIEQVLNRLSVPGMAVYLTNEAHVVPASSNGHVTAYTGAVGQFFLYEGLNPVATSSITFSILTNPQVLTASISNVGSYIVSSGFDAGEATAQIVFRAAYKNTNYDKAFSLTKGTAGEAGSSANLMALRTTAQTFYFSGSGTVQGVNTITFDALLQNISGTATFYANNFNLAGTMIASYALGGTGNSNRTLLASSFSQAGSTMYSTVVASLTTAPGYSDRITVVRMQDGASGSAGSSAMNVGRRMDRRDQWFDYTTGLPVTTWTVETVNGPMGTLGLQHISNTTASDSIKSEKFALDPTKKHRVSLWAKQPSGNRVNIPFIQFYDAAGAIIGSATSNAVGWPGGIGTVSHNITAAIAFPTGWTLYTLEFGGDATTTIPTGAVAMALAGSFAYNGSTSTTVQLQDYHVVEIADDGANAVIAYLTNEAHTLPASSNGHVTAYTGASGQYVMVEGATTVNVASITFSVAADPQALTEVFSTNGFYNVTGGFDAGEANATLTLRGAYKGINYDKIFSLGKTVAGAGGTPGTPGAPGAMGPAGANILANGLMTAVNSVTGSLAEWSVIAGHSYDNTGGIDGGRCMWVASVNAQQTLWNQTIIPIDPFNEFLEVSVWMRSVTSGHRVYLVMDCLDERQRVIQPHREELLGWLKVYSAVVQGATSIPVYKPNVEDRQFSGYTANLVAQFLETQSGNLNGYEVWPHADDLVSRSITAVNTSASTSYDTLTLGSGTPYALSQFHNIGAGQDASTYRYWGVGNGGSYITTNSTWTKYTRTFGGYNTPYRRFLHNQAAQQELTTFRQRTRFVRFGFLTNNGGTVSPLYADDYVVRRRTYLGNTSRLVTDPLLLLGGGAWIWQNRFTMVATPTVALRWAPYSGHTGAGAFVLKTGTAVYDMNRAGGNPYD